MGGMIMVWVYYRVLVIGIFFIENSFRNYSVFRNYENVKKCFGGKFYKIVF